jgi:hypothetical protein
VYRVSFTHFHIFVIVYYLHVLNQFLTIIRPTRPVQCSIWGVGPRIVCDRRPKAGPATAAGREEKWSQALNAIVAWQQA